MSKTKLEQAVARLLVDLKRGGVPRDLSVVFKADLRTVLAALRVKQRVEAKDFAKMLKVQRGIRRLNPDLGRPHAVARAEQAVVKAALAWHTSGDWPGGTVFEYFQDALDDLAAERVKAKKRGGKR